MGIAMDLTQIKALTAELSKHVKTEQDLSTVMQQLLKTTIETTLSAELSEHLGYDKHQPKPTGNARNGYSLSGVADSGNSAKPRAATLILPTIRSAKS
jgi:transposase-like protein